MRAGGGIVAVEVVVEPVVVPVPTTIVPVEVADIQVAVGVANAQIPSISLPLKVLINNFRAVSNPAS